WVCKAVTIANASVAMTPSLKCGTKARSAGRRRKRVDMAVPAVLKCDLLFVYALPAKQKRVQWSVLRCSRRCGGDGVDAVLKHGNAGRISNAAQSTKINQQSDNVRIATI